MTSRAKPNPSTRTGLKWRAGRPRWEPSPASRKAGIGGLDLKNAEHAWLTYGAALDACAARSLWAGLIREAAQDGPVGQAARLALSQALEALPGPLDAADRQARALVEDLIALARRQLGRPVVHVLAGGGPRTLQAMIDGYFASVDAGAVEIADATAKNYRSMGRRLVAKFPDHTVGDLTRGKLRDWYVEMKRDSVHTANLATAAAAAFLKWATWQSPPWISESPATQLGRSTAPGRRVIWTIEEEKAFIPWCDANGFEDVADGVTLGLWTGARPWDMCEADLEDLEAATWRFIPHKGQKRGREALPGLLAPVKARLERRRAAAAIDTVQHLFGKTPFLWDFRTNRRHATDTLGRRYRDAKTLAGLRDAVPETLEHKRMQDTRDTCVTRLYLAGVPLDRIPSWTAHSPDDRDDILRDHYLALQDEGALADAAKLATWARPHGLVL